MGVDRVDLNGPIVFLTERKGMYELQLKQKQLGNRYIANTIGNIEWLIQNYNVAIQILTEVKEELHPRNEKYGGK